MSCLTLLDLLPGMCPCAGESKRENPFAKVACSPLLPSCPKARLGAVPSGHGFGHHLGAPDLPRTAGQRCGGPGMCVHKDEECLFFLIDFLRINAGQAERGSGGSCLPSVCDKKPSP